MDDTGKKGLHEDSRTIYCNKCLRHRDKWLETMVMEDCNHDVFCLICFNWLCGYFDAFGSQPD